MSMSGVKINEDCVNAYLEVKKNKTKYCVFKLNSKKTHIEPDHDTKRPFKKAVTPDDFEQFMTLMPENECRYAVFHTIITLTDNGTDSERDRIIFVSWAPDTAKIKDKMLHSSSKDAIKQAFEGIGIEFQCSSEQDMQGDEWIARLQDLPNLKMAGKISMFEGRPAGDW